MFNLNIFSRLAGGKARSEPRVEPAVSTLPSDTGSARRVMNLQSGASYEEWKETFAGLGGGAVTRDSAMKLTAMFGCISLLSGTTGTLSCRVVKKSNDGGTQIQNSHPVHYLINQEPHALFAAAVFFEGLYAIAFLTGNSYAEIERNRRGDIIALRPLMDAIVRPFMHNGRAAYSITENGKTFGRDQDDILHFRGSATMSGLEALSPLKCLSRTIGIGLDADEYAERFYKQGVNPPGYISYDAKVDEAMADEIRNYWTDKFGGVANSHIPAVLSEGGKFTSLLTDPETAQLFQSRAYQSLDIAQAFGVPPHMIGITEKSTSWGEGINAQTGQFYIVGVRKHIERFESELTRKLLTVDERKAGYRIKKNLDTLLRADLAARYDAHKIALGGTQHPGWMTPNQIMAIEGLEKSDDPLADQLFRPIPKAASDTGSGDDDGGGDGEQNPPRPMFKSKRDDEV